MLVVLALIFFVASIATTRAQDETFCGTSMLPPSPLSNQIGGMFLPSGAGVINGVPITSPSTIYTIVLFLEFGDDDTPNTDSWPKGSPPTQMMQDIIDRPGAPFSGNKYNITTYFRDMSGDKLRIVGNCYYVKTRYTLAQYRRGITQAEAAAAGHPDDFKTSFSPAVRYWATRHALEDIGRNNVCDYSAYDSWILNGAYNYREAISEPSDGVVDLIVTCWRNDGSYADPSDPNGR
jgi:hypothetical protein